MVSFKLKLVSYFVLLTLVPLGAALWGLDTLAQRSETRRADARLEAGLRTALNAYQDRVDALDRSGTKLANYRPFQRALRERDRSALAEFVAANHDVRVVAGGLSVGKAPPSGAVVRRVTVVSRGTVLGSLVSWFRIDSAFVERLAQRSGFEPGDQLVVVRSGRVRYAAAGLVGARISPRPGRPDVERAGDTRYRVLSTPPLDLPAGTSLAVLTPQHEIDAAARSSERTMMLALAVSLVLAGLVAYGLSRSIVGTLGRLARAAEAISAGRLGERVPVGGRDEFGQLARAFNAMAAQLEARVIELESERSRLTRATNRIGDALAATHDTDQLLLVVVETAVEATGATGGVVRGSDGSERASVGVHDADGLQTLELPLRAGRRTFGTLVLSGPGFGNEERETAATLAGQAVIALENARLHRMVERQALVDGLTGLANRRSCEEMLRSELSRAERFGGDVAVVLADIDGFKEINDRHGHPVGDLVLREFARRLRHTVREIDVAARWGGEEFCLVLPGTDAVGGTMVAERARTALEGRPIVLPGGGEIKVTASFGVASYPDHTAEQTLVQAADNALYDAKGGGKNRVVTAPQPVARA